MKSFICLILILCLSSSSALAQSNFARYFDEGSIPVFNFSKHLNIKFNWDMKGNVQVHLNEGLNYLEEGNVELAITNFDKVIEIDSVSWLSFYYRGVCNRKLGKVKFAERDLLTARRLKSDQAEICVELGELYQMSKDGEKAAQLYEEAIRINPKLVNSYFNLGTTELGNGELRKALKLFQKCIEVDPKFPDAYVAAGIMKFKDNRKNTESILLFTNALKADSAFALAYFWRGLVHIAGERKEKALEDWSRFILFNPANIFILTMRGFLFIEMNRFDEAFTDLRKAFLSKTLDGDKFMGAQTMLDKQIDLQAATHYLIRNGYGLKDETFSYLKKGYCMLLASRTKDALDALDKSEALEATATVFFLKAINYEHLNDHPSAFQYYSKALNLDNDIFDAHKKRSIYFVELKDWKSANADFNDMIRLQPESLLTYRLRGISKANMGDYYGAIIDLTKFIKADSADAEAVRTRSACRQRIGDVKGANEDLRMLLPFEQPTWANYEHVAKNYLTLKDTANAVEVLMSYIDKTNESMKGLNNSTGVLLEFAGVEAHLLLAELYVFQKKWDQVYKEIRIIRPMVQQNWLLAPQSRLSYIEGLINYYHFNFITAIESFSDALKKDENNHDAKYFRAKAYEKAGLKKKFLADLKDLGSIEFKDSKQLYEANLGK